MLFTILGFFIGCASGHLINRLLFGPEKSFWRDTRTVERICIAIFCMGIGTATGFIYGANKLQNQQHPYNYLFGK